MRLSGGYHSDFRPWFAWIPVRTIDGEWVWLETVERVWYQSPAITENDFKRTSGLNWAYRRRTT
jgi:hypothetical protein